MESITETPVESKTPVEKRAFELAEAVLNAESERVGKPILEGDENAGRVTAWLDWYADKIVTSLGLIDKGELPLAKREPVTWEALMGFRPTKLDASEIEDALAEIERAEQDSPLDADEQHLKGQIKALETALDAQGSNGIAVLDGYMDDYISESLPYDFPEWVNDHVDWSAVEQSLSRYATRVETEAGDYLVIDELR